MARNVLPVAASLTAAQASGTAAMDFTACAYQLANSAGSMRITLSGTWSATVQFEYTAYFNPLLAGSTPVAPTAWSALAVTPVAGGSTVTSTTANGSWCVDTPGIAAIRVRCSAFTSGTIIATLAVSASPDPALVAA